MLRRCVFAAGGAGNVDVTRAEAALLFGLNDLLRESPEGGGPAWRDLFVQGVVNHVMADMGYRAPSHDEAKRQAAFLAAPTRGVAGFLSGVAGSLFGRGGQSEVEARPSVGERREAAAAEAERITVDETAWVAERIGRDSAFDPNERVLLERLREHADALPEPLAALLDRAR